MPDTAPTHRRTRSTLIAAAIGVVAVVATGTLIHQATSSTAAPPDVSLSAPASPAGPAATAPAPRSELAPGDGGQAATDGALTQADGILPSGVTVFEDQYPAVANLDPDLRAALSAAATAAAGDGIELDVNSGWRSPEYQEQLFRDAISEYGSAGEAARWVATADTSAHVTGDAVDIGSSDATAWLSAHGASYGLCQTYGNESWHFELHPEAVAHGCPQPYADPTQDPRMQR